MLFKMRQHLETPARLTSARLVLGLVAIGLAGCALGRSEIDVAVPPAHVAEAKRTVTIIEIRDLRPFAVDPHDPASPSLASDAEVHNPAVTERAVGRKRSSYGARLGDVLLPEGQTVTGLVRSAATTALREKGYIVVDDPSLPEVVPLSIDIEQFWAWFKPGLLQVTVEFDSQLRIYGRDMVGNTATVVRGRSSVVDLVASDRTWATAIQQGLDNLVVSMKDEIEAAEAPPSVATVPASPLR